MYFSLVEKAAITDMIALLHSNMLSFSRYIRV
jgi:hypothetical protein